MAKKLKIVTIELLLASQEVDFISFEEKRSLLDGDIIIFRPNLHMWCNCQYYSSEAKAACEHWQQTWNNC